MSIPSTATPSLPARRRRRDRRRHHRHLHGPRAGRARRPASPCARRATSPASSRAATGAGCATGPRPARDAADRRGAADLGGWTSGVGGETGFRRAASSTPATTTPTRRRHERWALHARAPTSSTPDALAAPSRPTRARRRGIGSGRALYPSRRTGRAAEGGTRHRQRARELGAHVLPSAPSAASRPRAGRVSRRRDRAGPIACSSVVLAGGAWSSLFAGSFGLACRSSRCWPRCCAPSRWTAGRSRRSGPRLRLPEARATAATPSPTGTPTSSTSCPTASAIRAFLPALQARVADARASGVGGRFLDELRTPRRWPLDEASPFEPRACSTPRRAGAATRALGALRRGLPGLRAGAGRPALGRARST